MCLSTSTIFSIVVGSMSVDVILFSTAKTTPSAVWMPMAVDPNLMASIAYSTCNLSSKSQNISTYFKKISSNAGLLGRVVLQVRKC